MSKTKKAKAKAKTLTTTTLTKFFLPHADLDLLTKRPDNRLNEDAPAHVRKIRASIREQGFVESGYISINSNFVIQDGHNRYQAALEEGSGVWYVIDDGFDLLRDNQRLGLAKKWNTMDYVRGYAREKGGAYEDIMKIHNEYGNRIGLKVIIASAAGKTNEASGVVFEMIRTGEFEFPEGINYHTMKSDMEEVLKINDLVIPLVRKTQVNNHFSLAYFWIREQEHFDKSKFFKKLSIMEKEVRPQIGGQKPNRIKLVDINNYNLRKNRIASPS